MWYAELVLRIGGEGYFFLFLEKQDIYMKNYVLRVFSYIPFLIPGH
jgi:hypothetical protein